MTKKILVVTASEIDGVVESLSDMAERAVPVKDASGRLKASNITQDIDGSIRVSEKLLAEKGVDSTGNTYELGSGLSISASGQTQVNTSHATGKKYMPPYQFIDKNGTGVPFSLDVSAEIHEDDRQPIFDTGLTSPAVFNLVDDGVNEIVNALYFKTNGDLSSFRMTFKSIDTGLIVDNYPDKFTVARDEGVSLIGAGVHKIDMYFIGEVTPATTLTGSITELTLTWDGPGTILGNSSGAPYYECDVQSFTFQDIAYALTEAAPRIAAFLSTDKTLDGTEQIIDFDSTKWAKGITVSAGVFTFPEDGYYTGNVNVFIDESGDPDIITWCECRPFATGEWELCGGGMILYHPVVDTGTSFPFNGGFDFFEGDQVRIKIKKLSATAALESRAQTVALGDLTQPSASIVIQKTDRKL